MTMKKGTTDPATGKRWMSDDKGGHWVTLAAYEAALAKDAITRKQRRGGINPITGLHENYVGLDKAGRLQYKSSIAEPLGLEDKDHQFDTELTATKERRVSSDRKRTVFTRRGKAHDPGGFKFEADVRKFWQGRMDAFEDFTADRATAIGSDFRGFDRELQKIVYVEAQPQFHNPTDNEIRGISKAKDEDAIYVIHTRRGWGRYTPADFEQFTGYRLKRRRA